MSLTKNINQVFLRGFEKMVNSYMQSIKSLSSVTYADEQKYISQMSAIDAYDWTTGIICDVHVQIILVHANYIRLTQSEM